MRRVCGRVRRFGVRGEDGESFGVECESLLEVGGKKIDGYFGWITVRKWSMYCCTQGRYEGSASMPYGYSARQYPCNACVRVTFEPGTCTSCGTPKWPVFGSRTTGSCGPPECTSPAPETACDKVESKKLVRVRKTRYSKQIKSKLIKILVFCHYPNVLSTIG